MTATAVDKNVLRLDVYFHEDKAGQLAQNAAGRLSFRYDDAYIAKKGAPLSLNMQVRAEAYDDDIATPYFSSLLPEEGMRTALAKNIGTSEQNIFALLQEVGRECAGALSLYPAGEQPPFDKKPHIILLQEEQIARILDELRRSPLLRGMNLSGAEDDGVRMSLAGAQAKLAVSTLGGAMDGQIVLVTGGAPTTHIIKPAIPDLEDIVENEFFCMSLADALKIPVAPVIMREAKGKRFLLVKRYDRTWNAQAKRIERLHQEDFCQALGIPPQRKYEKHGGPGLPACMQLIKRYSAKPALDQGNLIQLAMFNYFIGNADAHGKNFSFLYESDEVRLTPAYDLLSTAVYDHLDKKMAMKIGDHYDPNMIVPRHWYSLTTGNKTAYRALDRLLKSLAEALPLAARELRNTLADNGITSPVFDKIIAIIDTRTKETLAALAAPPATS